MKNIKESKKEGKKSYYTQMNVGSSKYVVNYHDGKKTHKDGSDFYDIEIFKNKKDFEDFQKKLKKDGYMMESKTRQENIIKIKEEVRIGNYILEKGDKIRILNESIDYLVLEGSQPFAVRIVKQGENYGLNNKLTHNESEPLVEFYDYTNAGRGPWGKYGQFVSRYYLSTILARPTNRGLDLQGDVPEWTVSAEQMKYFYNNYHKLL